jgi:pantoate--beta-alanine ligase
MEVIRQPHEMQRMINERRCAGAGIGLVPTMGFFHAGHISLMEAARRENDIVAVSIFVNPTQFGPHEDLEAYPRDLKRDLEMAERAGVDYVFNPEASDMYPKPYLTYIEVKGVTEGLCGAQRQGHFGGVATVVAKLFHIIPAHRAYFGMKDAQQVRAIEKMVEDLNMDIVVVRCPTVREPDGLAMSSRNMYLEPDERAAATVLYRALRRAEGMIADGERDVAVITAAMDDLIANEPGVEPEYIEIVDYTLLKPPGELQGEILIALAARVGKARLIDNLLLNLS